MWQINSLQSVFSLCKDKKRIVSAYFPVSLFDRSFVDLNVFNLTGKYESLFSQGTQQELKCSDHYCTMKLINRYIFGYTVIRDVIYTIVITYLFHRPVDNITLYAVSCIAMGLISILLQSKVRKLLLADSSTGGRTGLLVFPQWYTYISCGLDLVTLLFIFIDSIPPIIYVCLVVIHLAIVVYLLVRKLAM